MVGTSVGERRSVQVRVMNLDRIVSNSVEKLGTWLYFFTCPSIHDCRPKKTPLWFMWFHPVARSVQPRCGDIKYAFSSPSANCIKVSIDARWGLEISSLSWTYTPRSKNMHLSDRLCIYHRRHPSINTAIPLREGVHPSDRSCVYHQYCASHTRSLPTRDCMDLNSHSVCIVNAAFQLPHPQNRDGIPIWAITICRLSAVLPI
jgi:hypothetical protein